MAELIALAFIAMAGLSTILGALPLVVVRKLSHRSHDTVLGYVAGIMLGVAVLGLILHVGGGSGAQVDVMAVSTVLGGLVIVSLMGAMRRIPLPMPFVKNGDRNGTSIAFLIFLSLAIHNAPEGLATGVGYSQGLTSLGHSIAISIAFQNIPEGLLVATAVMGETGSRRAGVGYAVLSALVEPVVGFAAFFALALSPAAVVAASGFAAGAMLFVVFFQIIPESHRHGYHWAATVALMAGLATSVAIDLILGTVA